MKFSQYAISESTKSTHDVFQHGALLVKGKDIVATGHNDQFHHAEESVILKCIQGVLHKPKGQS